MSQEVREAKKGYA